MEPTPSVEAKLRDELKQSNEKLRGAEQEKRRLQERNEELEIALDEADRDAREAEALNGHLQRRVDEMEVQIAALRQYEAEFDQKVTKMLDERDEALTVAAKDKEAILLKVKELQEELAQQRGAEGLADASELAMMLKERQLEIEDLLDRNEELEEDLAKVREELQKLPGRPPAPDTSSLTLGIEQGTQNVEERLRNLKADALEKDARLLEAEKKLTQLAKSLGAEEILQENRQLHREHAEMKRQVAEAKRDLSTYLSEASSIVYENDLLRGIANVKPEQLKLQDFKLRDKVTSAKATARAKQLEKENSELEEERTKLKLRLRQLSELAAEKVSLLHDLQPEQMLQLEEIATRLRQGKLELPLDDQSRVLKEERDELKKRLSMKDQEVAQHVDRKVEEVLKKQGFLKDLEVKLSGLEKDNELLRSSLEAYQAAYADLAQGGAQGPRPPAPPGAPRPPAAPGQRFGLAAPAVLPRIPGMQPLAWSALLQAGLQLPQELADGSPDTVCSLYCQVIEALEELARERQLRASLGEEVTAFQNKYDRLLAGQEVLYKDFFTKRDAWQLEKKELEERLQVQGNLLMDALKKCDIQEEQVKVWQRLEVGGPEGALREELMTAMTRCASLEQNESVLSRKYESEKQNHSIVKDAFDTMQKDFLEREGFLKERLSKVVLWKRRSANALRIAQRKIRSMVAGSDFERSQQQLQVCRQREFDLSRRHTELTMKVSQQEDKLRDMMDLQDRCRSLEHLVRETEQEFTVLRRRLSAVEPRFAAECGLWARLTTELQRVLGFVGSFEAASRALGHSEARVLGEHVEASNVEVSLDEKLRKLDTNSDGFIGLAELRRFFEGLSIKIKDEEMQLLADALHPSTPLLPPTAPPAPPGQAAPPIVEDQSSVSVLGIIGRFRLFGLRALEPEELFWCAVQAHLLRRPDQPTAQELLRSNFQRLCNAEGHIAATDVLQILTQFEVAPNQLPLRSLRRVLQWLGVEPRSLEEALPSKQLPPPGDAQEPAYRLKLQGLRIVYADFAERFERGLQRALQQLRPPEAEPLMPSEPVHDPEARCQAARARESAANRRCVVLEQEVRTKDRIVRELQRQVAELEGFLERLESEIYEERSSKVRLLGQLDETLPKVEVEPKLRQLEELRFQVDQSRLALKQAKDLARTCASQSESYEKLLKRRQQEVRHLQESVKFLQATDEMSNNVGKLQYRLLLSQWEKGNLQRQLQAAVQDLREARREVLENEEQVEQERQQHDDTEEQLQKQLLVLKAQAARLQDEKTAAMPIDKARQLTSRLEEISHSKMELETRLSKVRLELLRNQAETDECRLKAQQATELMRELKALDPDDEAPRQRLLEMAKKLADSKLKELQHKRSLEIVQEQQQQLEKARKADEQEILSLQREVASAETRLADQEQQWRQKVLEAQGAAQGAQGVRGVRRASVGTLETLEQMQAKILERDARITALESDMEKAKRERENALQEERVKVRKLELELNLLSDGDTMRLRSQLRAEHDAEVAQVTAAAEASVQTLQELLDQTEERLRQQQVEMSRLYEKQAEMQSKHGEEALAVQQEIAGLRQELVQAKHQHADSDGAARLAPLPPDESARLAESFGSEGLENFGHVESRLRQHQEQVLGLYHRLEQQQEEYNSLLDQQHTEAKQREDQLREYQQKMQQEFQSREQRLLDQHESQRQQRDLELQRIQQELASLRGGGNQQVREQVAEAQWHADLALQHNEQVNQHRLAEWQQVERRKEELEEELRLEREKNKDSKLRKQQAQLRRQLATKEEQLSGLKKAVEDLKDRVVQLSIRNEREELESSQARRAETEVRERIGGQEEKMQQLKDQVARLSRQLHEAKLVQNQQANAEDGRESLQRLLEESGKELEMKSAEARRLEDELLRSQRRLAEAEAALKVERGVLEGESKIVKRQGEEALKANARRVAALLDRVEVLQAERNELAAKLQGAEAQLAGTVRRPSGEPMAEMKERLKREQELRQSLQEEVRELSIQLELRRPRSPPRSPSPSPSVSPGRSPAPRSLKQASELAARCGQLQAELAQLQARNQVLAEENDDLKLRLASEAGERNGAEAEILRGSLEGLHAHNRALASEISQERLRNAGADSGRVQQLSQEVSLLQRRVEELSRDNLQLQLGGMQREQAAQRHAGAAVADQQLKLLQERNAALEAQVQQLRGDSAQLQRAAGVPLDQQVQMQRLQERNAALEAQVHQLQGEGAQRAAVADQQLKLLQERNAALEAQVQQLRGDSAQLQRAAGVPLDQQVQMRRLQERNAALEAQVHQLQGEGAQRAAGVPLDQQVLMQRLQERNAVLEAQVQPLGGVAVSEQQLRQLQERNSGLQAKIDALESEKAQLERAPGGVQVQLMQLQAENHELHCELAKLQRSSEADEMLKAKRQVAELQVKVDELMRAPGSPEESVSPLEEVTNRLVKRNEELAEENVQLFKELEALKSLQEEEGRRQGDLAHQELQAKRARAFDVVHNRAPKVDAPWNPLRDLRDLVIKKEERGEEGVLRRLVQLFEPERSSTISSPVFTAILHDQLGLDDARAEFVHFVFEALDEDQDGLVSYQDFEKAVLGARSPSELLEGLPHASQRPQLEDMDALSAAQALWTQLQKKNLSLLKILDPDMHGKISFKALKSACRRHQLGLQEQDFARLAMALCPDRRQIFSTFRLQRLLRSAEEAKLVGAEKVQLPSLTSALHGHGQALQAPPRRPTADRREDREVKQRSKVEQLQSALFQSEEERARLQRELDRQEEVREENPRPLSVLLSAGDQAPPVVKELKLEVRGTKELRDKIFGLENELDLCRRRLEVDARQQLEKEQHWVRQLQAELEEKERSCSELIFDLRRARSAAGESDWAMREEEYMRLNLQLRRLDEELQAARRNEQQCADRLLEADHQIFQLRFEREQAVHRSARLERRVMEFELADSPRRPSTQPAAAKLQSRKERNLESAVEGLERVVAAQKGDIGRLRTELERRPSERRPGELEKLRKRLRELQEQQAPHEGLVDELRQALNAKEDRISELEQEVRAARQEAPNETQRLQQELAELRRARGEDAAALDEAQRALHEAEKTEQRYLEVARENRKLREDLSALEDEGFWQEIESLQRRNEQATTLAKDSKEALQRMASLPGAVDVTALVARLDTFAAPAA